MEALLPDEAGDEPGALPAGAGDLTTRDQTGACPGFGVGISVEGDNVSLDWSATGPLGGEVTVYRSLDAKALLELDPGALRPGVEAFVLDPGATSFLDAGAADRDEHTPTYYYRLSVETENALTLSTMVMKTTTAMAPGYNKFGVCMLDGPTRASDVVARLGDSVVGVWGWDPAAQTYLNWTPAHGVGSDADFEIPFGGLFAAQVDESTPSYQSLVGVVPRDDAFSVSAESGYNWTTLPVFYDGPSTASYWVDEVGYWGMGRWDNLAQSASFYWGAASEYPDFEIEACKPYYVYLPDTACTSNAECADDKFCYFVDAATCGDVAAGLCKPRPPGCEFAPQGDVCGCDGVTYPSACEAEQSGASVASDGACDPCADDPCVNGTCTPAPPSDNGANRDGDGNGGGDNGGGDNGNGGDAGGDNGNGGGAGGDNGNGGGGFTCQCEPGYSGILCDTPDPPPGSDDPGDSGVPTGSGDPGGSGGSGGSDGSGVPDGPDEPACADEDLGSLVPRTIEGNLLGQGDDFPSTCGVGEGEDRAYRFTAPSEGLYQLDTLGSEGDTVMAVYDECDGPEVACNDDAGLWSDEQSAVIVRHLEAGQSVIIVVDSYAGEGAGFTLSIAAVEGWDCEANNPCTPENMAAGTYDYASTIPGMYIHCIDFGGGASACERHNCGDYEQEWAEIVVDSCLW